MNSKELRAQRAQLVAEAQALIPADGKITGEIRTKFDSIMVDADHMASVITRLETEERSAAETRGKELNLPNPGQNVDSDGRTPEQRKKDVSAALRTYLSTGRIETRDLTVAGNGVIIPTGVADPNVALKSAGSIYSLVGKMSTATGEPMKAPTLNDTGNGFVLNSAGITTTDPSSGGPTISIDDLRSNPILIENSLLQDSSFDLASYVVAAIASRYERTAAKYITQGNSSNVGALTAITAGITTGTTGALKYADFVSALVALDPAYSEAAVWTLNNATLGVVLNLVDSQNRPLFLAYNDGAASGFVGSILGHPVKINPYLPNVATGNVAVQFGDFKSGYVFREVQPGVVLRRLEERYAELNKVGFVAFARVGGAVIDAGTSPIMSITVK